MNSSNVKPQEWEKEFKAREIKPSEWEGQRENFTRLYFTEDRGLEEVRRIMAEQYKFYAKPTQYKTAIKKWDLGKNLKKRKVLPMLRIQDERELEGKRTEFGFKGQLVSEQNLGRARKRHRGMGEFPEWEQLSSPISTPSDVTYWTPKPPITSSDAGSESGGDTPCPRAFYTESPEPHSPRETVTHITSPNQSEYMQEFFDLCITPPAAGALPASLHLDGGISFEEEFTEKVENKRDTEKLDGRGLGQSPEHSKSHNTPMTSDTFAQTPAWVPWLGSPEPLKLETPETPETPLNILCLECAIGGFTRYVSSFRKRLGVSNVLSREVMVYCLRSQYSMKLLRTKYLGASVK